jgi:hypothetical protein
MTDLPDMPETDTSMPRDIAIQIVDEIRTAQERAARIRENCAAIIADARQRADEAQREADAIEAYHAPELEAWLRANLKGDKRSIKLPTGTPSLRTVPGGLRLVDAGAALAWARQNKPALIETRESISITAIKAFVEASGGETPDGVENVSSREVFSVK